jgi:LmbE family N-acetylglucosaminyl deacetylase
MDFNASASAILLSPHLDDAALSCWGLLTDPDRELAVVTVFAGAPARGLKGRYDEGMWRRFPEVRSLLPDDWDSHDVVAQRRDEDRTALRSTHRAICHLDALDHQYRLDGQGADHEDFVRNLDAHRRECSRLYVPLAITPAFGWAAHPDHLLVREWGERLAGDGIPLTYYADLPYAFRPQDRDWVGALGLAQVEQLELTEDQVAAKLEALRKYSTQWPVLSALWDRGGGTALDEPGVWRFEATL